jgi:hypothetical protein
MHTPLAHSSSRSQPRHEWSVASQMFSVPEHCDDSVHSTHVPSAEQRARPTTSAHSSSVAHVDLQKPRLQTGLAESQSALVEHSAATHVKSAAQACPTRHGRSSSAPRSAHCASVTQHTFGFAFVHPPLGNAIIAVADAMQNSNTPNFIGPPSPFI